MPGPMPVHDPIAGRDLTSPQWIRWFHDLITQGIGDAATLASHLPSYFATATHLHTGIYLTPTDVGQWTPLAWSAGAFTASSGGWTVEAGDMDTYHYTRDGQRLTIGWQVTQTTTTAVTATLRLALPSGVVVARSGCAAHSYYTAAGGWDLGPVQVEPGTSDVRLYTRTRADWPKETNTVWTLGQITIEVA